LTDKGFEIQTKGREITVNLPIERLFSAPGVKKAFVIKAYKVYTMSYQGKIQSSYEKKGRNVWGQVFYFSVGGIFEQVCLFRNQFK
jgi:hypothetical protein